MIYVFLAQGFEEIEAVTTIDILRRAGYGVKTVGIGSSDVTGSHGICIKADIGFDGVEFDKIEAIVLPGGQPGTENLYESEQVRSCIAYCIEKNLTVCAICAAPTVLGRLGYLEGKKAVCYPGCEDQLLGAQILNRERVCIDGNIVTGRGPGCTIDFALAIIDVLFGGKLDSITIKAGLQCS